MLAENTSDGARLFLARAYHYHAEFPGQAPAELRSVYRSCVFLAACSNHLHAILRHDAPPISYEFNELAALLRDELGLAEPLLGRLERDLNRVRDGGCFRACGRAWVSACDTAFFLADHTLRRLGRLECRMEDATPADFLRLGRYFKKASGRYGLPDNKEVAWVITGIRSEVSRVADQWRLLAAGGPMNRWGVARPWEESDPWQGTVAGKAPGEGASAGDTALVRPMSPPRQVDETPPGVGQAQSPGADTPLWTDEDLRDEQPLVRRLLLRMHGRTRDDLHNLCREVWRRRQHLVSKDAVKKALQKANDFLERCDVPRRLSRERDEVTWV